MSKLFTLEELDQAIEQEELETSPEAGEVADVEAEASADMGEIDSVEDAVEDGVESADVLGQVEDVIEDSLEEGEGLDPIAAEAVRIAVESVCVRLGANPKSMYSLYATENFESASSRKHNTRIALESVKDFLSNLWEKIKAAVSNVWEKVRAFWNKHISNLGRVLKALEATKNKVSNLKGTSQATDDVKASGTLVKAFPGSGSLSDDVVAAFIKTHVDGRAEIDRDVLGLVDNLKNFGSNPLELRRHLHRNRNAKANVGTEKEPFVNGIWFELEEEFENTKAGDEDSIKYSIEITQNTETGDQDRNLGIASKDKMKSLVNETITLIKATIKARDKVEKNFKEFDKAKKDFEKTIGNMSTATDQDKDLRRKTAEALRAWSTVNSKFPSFASRVAALDVILAKNVIGYCNACMKTYK